MSHFGNCCPLEANDFQMSYCTAYIGQCLVTEMPGNLVWWFGPLESTSVILVLQEYMINFFHLKLVSD